jgi:hypothetical protein
MFPHNFGFIFLQERRIEVERRNHAILLDAHADRTRRAFCRHSHFDPGFLALLQLWKFEAIGDE